MGAGLSRNSSCGFFSGGNDWKSSCHFCGRVGHFARVWFKMTTPGFRASISKKCAGRMKILMVPAWIESFLLVLEKDIGVVSCS